jgi:ligand-binding SRPBCC domain-containing protein
MYQLKTTQVLPITIEKAWDFFSSPKNLKKITPEHMGFNVTSGNEDDTMYPGQIIIYRVSPILGIPLEWITEITHVIEPTYFVDEQRFGPYAFWQHQHHLKPVQNGVEITDVVNYQLRWNLLGRMAHALFVKKMLQEIFGYRSKKLEDLFKPEITGFN